MIANACAEEDLPTPFFRAARRQRCDYFYLQDNADVPVDGLLGLHCRCTELFYTALLGWADLPETTFIALFY